MRLGTPTIATHAFVGFVCSLARHERVCGLRFLLLLVSALCHSFGIGDLLCCVRWAMESTHRGQLLLLFERTPAPAIRRGGGGGRGARSHSQLSRQQQEKARSLPTKHTQTLVETRAIRCKSSSDERQMRLCLLLQASSATRPSSSSSESTNRCVCQGLVSHTRLSFVFIDHLSMFGRVSERASEL